MALLSLSGGRSCGSAPRGGKVVKLHGVLPAPKGAFAVPIQPHVKQVFDEQKLHGLVCGWWLVDPPSVTRTVTRAASSVLEKPCKH